MHAYRHLANATESENGTDRQTDRQFDVQTDGRIAASLYATYRRVGDITEQGACPVSELAGL